MSQSAVIARCSAPEAGSLQTAVAAAPAALQGSIWSQLQVIIVALEATFKTVNIQAVIALVPLFVAEFTAPSLANLEALGLAIAALFNPAPVAA